MTTTRTSTLHSVDPEVTDVTSTADTGGDPLGDPSRERYWARVQALRDDLDRLRPAN